MDRWPAVTEMMGPLDDVGFVRLVVTVNHMKTAMDIGAFLK